LVALADSRATANRTGVIARRIFTSPRWEGNSFTFEPRYVGAAVSGRARRFSGPAAETVDLRIAA
jgi:hypothetical protein